MPSNPLEKQFALLGTASTAGLLDVQKAYRSGFLPYLELFQICHFFSSPLELISIVLVIMSVNFVQLMKIYETMSF